MQLHQESRSPSERASRGSAARADNAFRWQCFLPLFVVSLALASSLSVGEFSTLEISISQSNLEEAARVTFELASSSLDECAAKCAVAAVASAAAASATVALQLAASAPVSCERQTIVLQSSLLHSSCRRAILRTRAPLRLCGAVICLETPRLLANLRSLRDYSCGGGGGGIGAACCSDHLVHLCKARPSAKQLSLSLANDEKLRGPSEAGSSKNYKRHSTLHVENL